MKKDKILYGQKKKKKKKYSRLTHLCTELKVNHDNTDLGTRYHQDDENQEEEAKQIVKLVLPDSLVGKKKHSQLV